MLRTSPARFPLAPVALAAAVALCTLSAPAVLAQTPAAAVELMHTIQLPAQPLGNALNELARQAKLQLLVQRELVEGKQAPALSGQMTARQALQRLLAGSGLSAQVEGASVVVRLAPGSEARQGGEVPEITVRAFQRVYRSTSTATALGMDANPMEVPLSTAQIPMDVLEDQQVNNVEDALRNVSAVTKFKQGNGGEEKFSIRGFDASQSLYKDGSRLNNLFNATNIATTETANIERYEVLKGPAAILYGQGEPGGVINYITKKPRFQSKRVAEVIVGSYDYKRAELDMTGPINQQWAYRLVASAQNSDDQRAYIERDRQLLAPSLTWRLTPQTLLTAQYEYIKDEYTQDRGQVLDTDPETGLLVYSSRLNNKQFFGVPGWNERTHSTYQRVALMADHEFDDGGSLRLQYARNRVDKTLFDSSPRETLQSDGTVRIRASLQQGDGESENGLIKYQKELAWGSLWGQALRHKLMVQLDSENITNEGTSATGNTITYNVNTGAYTGIPSGGIVLGATSPIATQTRQLGVVVQNLMSVGEHWTVLAGLRHTDHNDLEADVRQRAVSPRLGVVYKRSPDWSYYSSWSRGFVPSTLTGFNPATGNGVGGQPLDPETSQQLEVGVKALLLNQQLELNAAVFDLRKKNIGVTPAAAATLPSAEQWSANLGETRTLGLDVQVVGKLSSSFRVIGGYAYLDNELTAVGADFANQKGNRMPGIPVHSGNVWGVFEPQGGGLQGFGVGLGLFAQSKTYVSTENRAAYGRWAQLDAMAYYKAKDWKLQINIKNLTDRRYNLAQAGTTDDAFGGVRVGTAAPRTASLSLSVAF